MTAAVVARSERQALILRQIKRRGLTVQPVGAAGAVLVRGPGVDLLAASLRHVDARDLIPFKHL